MVKVKCYRNGSLLEFHDVLDDVSDVFETSHVLAGTLGYLDDDGSTHLLCSLQDCFCPLKVVGVECTDCIVSGICGLDHFFCRN